MGRERANKNLVFWGMLGDSNGVCWVILRGYVGHAVVKPE